MIPTTTDRSALTAVLSAVFPILAGMHLGSLAGFLVRTLLGAPVTAAAVVMVVYSILVAAVALKIAFAFPVPRRTTGVMAAVSGAVFVLALF